MERTIMKQREVQAHEAFVGARVAWVHTPRGGYGYTVEVPARISALSLDGTRATVMVQRRDGSEVARTIETARLRWRTREPT